ncbi:hypothetical protein VT84_08605 [Gemmata sp. SH-PL17]|nr:hypothetical protein VT84_08605 [Gemmata sp. SH-PL17]
MVRFTEFDGYLLWCLPEPGCDLAYLIWAYTFLNRDAVPSYPQLAECLRRSVSTGAILPPVGGHFRLSPECGLGFTSGTNSQPCLRMG